MVMGIVVKREIDDVLLQIVFLKFDAWLALAGSCCLFGDVVKSLLLTIDTNHTSKFAYSRHHNRLQYNHFLLTMIGVFLRNAYFKNAQTLDVRVF